jgi:predicted DNA-binding protein (MmcQ/YjbR family)
MAKPKQAEIALRQLALSLPEAYEDFPWGDRVFKVKKKIFLFLGRANGEGLGLAAKLAQTNQAALMLPFAAPTGYNLGKSGWVTATFSERESLPLPMLEDWVRESYRALAPATLVALLDSGAAPKETIKPSAKTKVGPRRSRARRV